MHMERLAVVARKLLPSMWDESSGLFAHKVVRSPAGVRPVRRNALYSAISAIGIENDRQDGKSRAVELDGTLDALCALALRKSSSTDLLAATIWALAVAGDSRTTSLLETLVRRFKASGCSSMELGLVLSGLAAAIDASPGQRDAGATVAAEATRELVKRFSDAAQLFRGSSWAIRPRRQLQWKMTTFANQVYPIHGLAQFSRAAETTPPIQIQRAADRLVEMQGALGQWSWIYSANTGAVVERYPVYAVHQDAMAFMALAPLHKLGMRSYRDELARGLRWIFGQNELRTSLVDFERSFISRCIQRRGADAEGPLGMSGSQWRRVILSSWGHRSSANEEPGPDDLEILEECRPYHLGWLLYARSLISDW
jgi:hypothetical protein